ncbi:MAG: GIY-YIG nuclease family protein [Candidatus Bathyarchaeia archaeon]
MRGVYTIVLMLEKSLRIKIGRLGLKNFREGFYAYVGSGLGRGSSSVLGRLRRHLKRGKKLFWHMDYLSSHKGVKILEVFYAETDFKMECVLNNEIWKTLRRNFFIKGFGSSDCNCESHLTWIGNKISIDRVKESIKKAYKNVGLKALELTK